MPWGLGNRVLLWAVTSQCPLYTLWKEKQDSCKRRSLLLFLLLFPSRAECDKHRMEGESTVGVQKRAPCILRKVVRDCNQRGLCGRGRISTGEVERAGWEGHVGGGHHMNSHEVGKLREGESWRREGVERCVGSPLGRPGMSR